MLKEFFKKYNLLTVLGPTASGKTAFAANLAFILNGEIISADSRQVYKDMNIGTGKDYSDYLVAGTKINYHLIDILPPGAKYNLYEFCVDFFKAYNSILVKEKLPILCGGTGLYIEAILRNYDLRPVPPNEDLRKNLKDKTLDELIEILSSLKKLHNKTDIDTKNRAIRAIEIALFEKNNTFPVAKPQINSINFGLAFPRELQKQKITERLKKRLEQGLVEEVKRLLDCGVSSDDLIYYGLEYKYVTLYILGQLSYNEMFEKLNIAIHQFAKRQMTFFRHMEKNGIKIHWIDAQLSMDDKIEKVIQILSQEINS